MKNGTGTKKQDAAGSPRTTTFDNEDVRGASILQTIADMPCNYTIGVYKSEILKVATVGKLDPNGSGSAFWNDLSENGLPTEKSEDKNLKEKKDVCVAVCGQLSVKPGTCEDLEFSFVWDMPKVKFPKSTKLYSKYYTKYFGAEGSAGERITEYALKNYGKWEHLIVDEWQKEILEDE